MSSGYTYIVLVTELHRQKHLPDNVFCLGLRNSGKKQRGLKLQIKEASLAFRNHLVWFTVSNWSVVQIHLRHMATVHTYDFTERSNHSAILANRYFS